MIQFLLNFRRGVDSGFRKMDNQGFNLLFLAFQLFPCVFLKKAQFPAFFRKSEISIILPKMEAMFRTRREHAVRFGYSTGDQVIQHHTNVSFSTQQ